MTWLLRLLFVFAIALPLGAGPAMSTLFGEPEHTCLCGMKAGECGCPECVQLEKSKVAERKSGAPIVRSGCTDQDVVAAPALPNAVASAIVALVPAPRGERIGIIDTRLHETQTVRAPPTPPPRA